MSCLLPVYVPVFHRALMLKCLWQGKGVRGIEC